MFRRRKKSGLLGEKVDYNSIRVVFRQYGEGLAIAVAIALILRFFVVSAFQVTSESMNPTLLPGDFVLAYKLPYGWPIPFVDGIRIGRRSPRRGEVIVIRRPENRRMVYAKRVVGIAGDRVEVRRGRLYVNGLPSKYFNASPGGVLSQSDVKNGGANHYTEYTEGYHHRVLLSDKAQSQSFGPTVVPPGHLFLLGDDREIEDDSRLWGVVPETYIEGQVVLVWLSLDWSQRDAETGWPGLRKERLFKSVD